MLRGIAGVIVGYIIMAIVLFVVFTGAYLAMGPDTAFQAGTYQISFPWIVLSLVVGFLAALLGGFLCAWIAGGRKAPMVLAGIVLVIGLLFGVIASMAPVRPEDHTRPAEVSNLEAMQHARQPLWFNLLNPLIGAAGVFFGGRLKRGPAHADE